QPVVLARRPQCSLLGIQMQLRGAPVRAACVPAAASTIGARTYCRGASGVVVGDFPWPNRIANIVDANARKELAAGKRGGFIAIVDAAVVSTIGKAVFTHQV